MIAAGNPVPVKPFQPIGKTVVCRSVIIKNRKLQGEEIIRMGEFDGIHLRHGFVEMHGLLVFQKRGKSNLWDGRWRVDPGGICH